MENHVPIVIYNFATKSMKRITEAEIAGDLNLPGHRYADNQAIASFVKAVASNDKTAIFTGRIVVEHRLFR